MNARQRIGMVMAGLGKGEIELRDEDTGVWYVDSNVAGGVSAGGRSPQRAVITIDEAINLASAGDTIYVASGHVETLADATSLVPDVDGLHIEGLGRGARRPTLTFSATGSNIPISGANVSFLNFLLLVSGVTNVTAGITVTGEDCKIDVEFRETAADAQFVDGIVAAATSDRMHILGLTFRGHPTGDANAAAVSVTGAVDGVVIENFNVDGLFSAAGIENVTGVCTNIVVQDGLIRQRHATQDAGIAMVATSTGFGRDVDIRTATNDDAGLTGAVVGAAMQWYRIGLVNADDEHAAESEVSDLDVTNTRSGKTFSTIA